MAIHSYPFNYPEHTIVLYTQVPKTRASPITCRLNQSTITMNHRPPSSPPPKLNRELCPLTGPCLSPQLTIIAAHLVQFQNLTHLHKQPPMAAMATSSTSPAIKPKSTTPKLSRPLKSSMPTYPIRARARPHSAGVALCSRYPSNRAAFND
ncbi:hypothetical protein M0R45_035809 [Rubus argutus]|uniref:Uncharacterized protein n=1 Tax=Rubus argutus TaxID=59490 RepID=A0AAW1VYH3_RUBAR